MAKSKAEEWLEKDKLTLLEAWARDGLNDEQIAKNMGIYIKLTNINIEPNRINYNYLKNINIKLTKGLIGKIEIRIGVNTFEIKI